MPIARPRSNRPKVIPRPRREGSCVHQGPYAGGVDAAPSPYAPSWYDRLQTWVERRVGPPWLAYIGAFVVIAGVLDAIAWLSGFVAPGELDPYINSGAAYMVIGYAGMHVLDVSAARAWRAFRPATRLDDAASDRFAYELTTMPARPALVATLVGLAVSLVYVVSQYGRPFDLGRQPVLFALSVLVVTIGFVGTAGAFYHSIHQLRAIGRAHRFVGDVDLLHLGPLHAFAGVTATTGILLLVIGYLAIPTNPSPTSNPVVIAIAVASIGLAIACFAIPLVGIRAVIGAERSRRLGTVNRLLGEGLAELHRRAEARDLTDADPLSKQLASLMSERDLVARVPTWPWAAQTLQGFTAAIVIPVALWLTYRFLERAL